MNIKKYLLLISLLTYNISAFAGEVDILAVSLYHQSQNEYAINVKLQHDDTGWAHYADAWRIVDEQGHILGTRILLHPHINEQPFTRSLNNIKLSDELETIYIEAHDTVHGWTANRLVIDLNKMQNGRLSVSAK